MKMTIDDAAATKFRKKSHFYSEGLVKMEIAAERKTPTARTRFKDNLVFKTNEHVIINSTCSQITRPLYLDRQAMETNET